MRVRSTRRVAAGRGAKRRMEGALGYQGGCRCGAVRYRVEGEPEVVGLCHCADCRKETGGLFLAYADWPIGRFSVEGRYATWGGRSFCPICGSRLFHLSETEAEILLGSLDAAPAGSVGRKIGARQNRSERMSN